MTLSQEEPQPLADIEEFCGKIKACKDTQKDPDFCVVARVESFIAGRGLQVFFFFFCRHKRILGYYCI
jgi:phosphoenolpyruvate phosphomutase